MLSKDSSIICRFFDTVAESFLSVLNYNVVFTMVTFILLTNRFPFILVDQQKENQEASWTRKSRSWSCR